MKKDFLSVFEAAVLIGVVAIAACSDDSNPDPGGAAGGQAGCPAAGAAGAEAGCPAGCPAAGAAGAEAGCPAGCPAAGAAGAEAGCPASTPGDAQTPATGAAADIDAWIAKGDYKKWKCESAVHEARSPSPHGKNRICSNDLLSAAGDGEFPTGAASVKELYDDAGTTIVGHAVYLKTKAGAGESFYWYEVSSSLGGVVANGTGDSGTAKSICVGCHSAAGADANHSGHDFVYTQVK
jgi:hypothetical protein